MDSSTCQADEDLVIKRGRGERLLVIGGSGFICPGRLRNLLQTWGWPEMNL